MTRMNNKFMALLLSDEDADFEQVFMSFSEEEQHSFFKQLMEISIWMMQQTKWEDIPAEFKSAMIIGMVGQLPIEARQAYLAEFDTEEETWTRVFNSDNPNWSKNPEINKIFVQCQQNYANHLLHARGFIFLNEVFDLLGLPHEPIGQTVGWSSGDGTSVDFGTLEEVDNTIVLTFNVDEDAWTKICEIMEDKT